MALRNKTIKGLFWSISEKIGFALIQFVVVMILARVLEPEDFGLIACLSFFMGFSNALVEGGFSQALIYRQDVTHVDCSSVFFINIFVGMFTYGVIFFLAPLIAAFYDQPSLVDLSRVLCLVFLINSFSKVHNALLVKEMSFKKLLLIRVPSFFIGGVTGILMAFMGMGVWSLVFQQLTTQIVNTLQFTLRSHWRPSFIFNWERVKLLSTYGSNLMFTSVLEVFYANMDSILIGRFASMTDVGFFQRAKSTKQLPVGALSSSLDSVTFSVLSSITGDNERLRRAYKELISKILFLLSPILISGAILGKALFTILFTEKWLPAVPYFQWLCLAGIFQIINAYNLNILKVKGRTDLFLKINVARKVIQSVLIFFAITKSIMFMVVTLFISEIVSYLINSYLCGNFIDYSLKEQLKDLLPIAALNFVLGAVVYFLSVVNDSSPQMTLLICILPGILLYVIIAYAIRLETFMSLKELVISKLR